MNTPAKSKINWTSLAMALIGVAVAGGLVPAEMKEPLMEVALIVGPVLVATFRTYFNEK